MNPEEVVLFYQALGGAFSLRGVCFRDVHVRGSRGDTYWWREETVPLLNTLRLGKVPRGTVKVGNSNEGRPDLRTEQNWRRRLSGMSAQKEVN